MFHFQLLNYTAYLLPNETYYVENIKYRNFILGTIIKSTNLRIHELVIFNQSMKIDAHKENYFYSTLLDLTASLVGYF